MLDGTDAAPCAVRARSLGRNLDVDTLSALSYLAHVCESQTPYSTRGLRDALRRAESLRNSPSSTRISGTLVAGYTLLERAMRANDGTSIERRLLSFDGRRVIGSPTRVAALGRPTITRVEADDLTEVFSRELAQSGQNSDIFDPVDDVAVDRSLEAVGMALNTIADVAPDLAAEISELVTDIVIIDSTKTNAASTFAAFGVVVLKFLKPFQTWTTYVEHIVHEAAHHLLFALCRQYELFASGTTKRFKSPLRSDPRPLDAVFHAMFVLSRIIFILRRIHDSDAYPDFHRTATYSFHNPAKLIDQFREAYDVIAANAELTDYGKTLLAKTFKFAEAYAFDEEPLIERTQ